MGTMGSRGAHDKSMLCTLNAAVNKQASYSCMPPVAPFTLSDAAHAQGMHVRVPKDVCCGLNLLHALSQVITACSLGQVRLVQHPLFGKQLLQHEDLDELR